MSEEAKSGVASIYGLTCPETGALRYVGKARDPNARFKGHMRETRLTTPVYAWIAKLRRQGLAPVLAILEEAPDDWREAERRLIAEARARGDRLLNVADGGDEPHCPKETIARNGRTNALALHADPVRKHIWLLKREIGQDLREGFISNKSRAKLREAARVAPGIFGCYANLPDREELPDGTPVQGYGRSPSRRAA